MANQFPSQNNGRVTVYIYEPELDFLKWLVLQKPQIETGGDLFGLWQDKGTAVIQLILGPGKECRRTTTSFYQDVAYLGEVGDYLTSSQGLCNIGQWHSHHTLSLAEPSHGDLETVWNHLPSVAGGKFLVFIANIRGTPATPKVIIGCFLFNLSQQKMLKGNIKCLPCPSPVRLTVDNTYITSRAELKQDWTTFSQYQASMQRNNTPNVENTGPNGGVGVSNITSSGKGNTNTKKGDPIPTNVESTTSNVENSKSKKKTSKPRARKRKSNKASSTLCHDEVEEETNEENDGEEDSLLSEDGCDEEELSKCGKIRKRIGQMFTSVNNFFRQRICYCC